MNDFRPDLHALDEARRPSAGELERIGQGVRDAVVQQAGRRPAFARAGMIALAVAASAAVVVGLSLRSPGNVDRVLSADTSRQDRIVDEVSVIYEGRGQVTGSPDDIDIHWERGTLRSDVAPERGVTLQVITAEATVRVVGTHFEVTRDAQGTSVVVSRGKVEVDCRGEETVSLAAGDSRRCYRSAEAALQDARRAPTPQRALAIIERGRALPGARAAHRELQVWQIEALRALERKDESLAAAKAYLAAGDEHRRPEVLRIASELAFEAGGCAAAMPWLGELAALPEAPAAARQQWAACRQAEAPTRRP